MAFLLQFDESAVVLAGLTDEAAGQIFKVLLSDYLTEKAILGELDQDFLREYGKEYALFLEVYQRKIEEKRVKMPRKVGNFMGVFLEKNRRKKDKYFAGRKSAEAQNRGKNWNFEKEGEGVSVGEQKKFLLGNKMINDNNNISFTHSPQEENKVFGEGAGEVILSRSEYDELVSRFGEDRVYSAIVKAGEAFRKRGGSTRSAGQTDRAYIERCLLNAPEGKARRIRRKEEEPEPEKGSFDVAEFFREAVKKSDSMLTKS